MKYMLVMVMDHKEGVPPTCPAMRFTDEYMDCDRLVPLMRSWVKKHYPNLRGKYKMEVYELGVSKQNFPNWYATWCEGKL